jgi:hypothetical protein
LAFDSVPSVAAVVEFEAQAGEKTKGGDVATLAELGWETSEYDENSSEREREEAKNQHMHARSD